MAYVPKLRYNLITLGALDDAGKHFLVEEGNVVMSDSVLLFKKLFGVYVGKARRIEYQSDDFTKLGTDGDTLKRHWARTAITRPGNNAPTSVDINLLHACYNHSNARLFAATASQLGVSLTGTL